MDISDKWIPVVIILLLVIGCALIAIPAWEQMQNIEEDDSIYADIAAQSRVTAAAPPICTETPVPVISPVPAAELPSVTEQPAADPEDSEGTILIPEETVIPSVPQDFTAFSPGVPLAEAALDLDSLLAQNPEFVGWISIPETEIDYPVVRSDDTQRYLGTLFSGQKSKLGCLFSLMTSDYEKPSKNIAIYGHHLSGSTAMFSTLLRYKDESYWADHPVIRMDTLYGVRSYRIFAVLNHKVTDWDASTARFTDDQSFMKFVNRARKAALYETGVAVSAEDHILTLITCDRSYGGVRGRLLVMAVEEK